jgi:hypothetical protein
MGKAELKNFGTPDEVREFPKGRLELIKVGGAIVGRAIFEPGWRWATSVQPIAKTKSCEAPHFQYHVSGVLRVRMDDGRSSTANPAMFPCFPPDMMHGLWATSRQSSSTSKGWLITRRLGELAQQLKSKGDIIRFNR